MVSHKYATPKIQCKTNQMITGISKNQTYIYKKNYEE